LTKENNVRKNITHNHTNQGMVVSRHEDRPVTDEDVTGQGSQSQSTRQLEQRGYDRRGKVVYTPNQRRKDSLERDTFREPETVPAQQQWAQTRQRNFLTSGRDMV
jgi:hypothetical protein